MRTSALVLPFVVFAIAILLARAETGARSERSIREWFSNFMKRFQRKENRQEPFYLRPAYPSYFQEPSFDEAAGNRYNQYQPPSYNHQNNVDVGFSGGFGGGHGSERDTSFSGSDTSHVSGAGGGRIHHVGAHVGVHGGDDIPKGFGPLKNSDVIGYAGAATVSHHNDNILSAPASGSSVGNIYEAPAVQHDAFNTPSLHEIDDGPSYDPPSNSIIASTPTRFVSKSREVNIPIALPSSPSPQYQDLSASNTFPTQSAYYLPAESSSQIVASGNPGESYFAPQLGPDDPIIEIVFQDGEPGPPPPPPVIDESLYAPASDDVEVYFIEYSPEDNLDDIKNLDLSGAQPAILQNLPTELPHELRDHLVNSGVLDNAQIEILDLDKALTDQSLDVNTRNALRQAYSRTNRQVPANAIIDNSRSNKNQAVDIRVQRLNHDSSTPEGIVEFLSGLKSYRKGTYAGVVEVNDKETNKYIPVSIDGGKLPLPETIPLENKKVEGVLVFADKKAREPKSSFLERKIIEAAPTAVESTIVPNHQRRMIDIQWADMDSNGWIPIVGS